jgi:hypothetical protein
VADRAAIKYRAFLSYAQADTAWATWLRARLEGFAIDKDLAGRGPVPKRGAGAAPDISQPRGFFQTATA